MTTSALLIIPAALRPAANSVGAAMGWGPENYTIPLSADGGITLTHYACRTNVDAAFLAAVANPPPIPGVAAVLSALVIDLSETLWGGDHMAAVLAAKAMVQYDA